MAENDKDVLSVPPAPPSGQVVTKEALYYSQISLYRNSLAFGGQRSPSEIWSTMVLNHPHAMMLYRELEEKDEDVSSALDTLRLSVLKRDRKLTPGDDSQLALDIADFIEDQLDSVKAFDNALDGQSEAGQDFHSVLDCILDAPGYGFSVQEMIFDTSMGQASLAAINDCPQELFLFGDRYQPQIGQLQFLGQPWASSGTPVPEEKFIIYSYRRRAGNRMGRPLLRSVFWPSWIKRNAYRLWLQFAEKGPGTAVVRYNDPDSETDKRQAAQIAQAIVECTAIGVPRGFEYDVELLKVARAQDPAVYEKLVEKHQYGITRKILGETLTSFGNEGGKGSNAMGNTHADTLDTRVIEQCRAVASVITRQLVRPLVLWNYGPDAPMPKWSFDIGEEEDLSKRLVVDSGLQRMGKKFSAGYVSNRYDVPLVPGEDPDIPLAPNVNAPQVSLTDRAVAFGETGMPREIHQDLKELDDVFAQLAAEARGEIRNRVKEVTAAIVPIGGA